MRISALFALFFLGFLTFSTPARAGFLDDLVCWAVPCMGNGDADFTRPNLDDAKTPHLIENANDPWVPQDWIDDQHSAQDVVSGLYRADIITDQSVSFFSATPHVEVGQGFMKLSDIDKSRVIRFVDEAGGYTKKYPAKTIEIYHKASGEPIGVYTQEYGLQLQ